MDDEQKIAVDEKLDEIKHTVSDHDFGLDYKVYRASGSIFVAPILKITNKELNTYLVKKLKFKFSVYPRVGKGATIRFSGEEVGKYTTRTTGNFFDYDAAFDKIKEVWKGYTDENFLLVLNLITDALNGYVIREVLPHHIKIANKKFPWKDFVIHIKENGAEAIGKERKFADPNFGNDLIEDVERMYDRHIAIKTIQRFTNYCYSKSSDAVMDVAKTIVKHSPESHPEKKKR